MANAEHVEILKQSVKIWNQWRTENPSIKPDLMQADLSHADLRQANLREAYLYEADLRFAEIHQANLHFANLQGANLSFANLISANLWGADLTYASLLSTDLGYADLSYATLSHTILSYADFTYATLSYATLKNSIWDNAILANTTLTQLDLSAVKNLDKVRHRGPSSVSHETLFSPKNQNIPQVFWRGCGVDEETLQHLKDCSWPYPVLRALYLLFPQGLHGMLQFRARETLLDR